MGEHEPGSYQSFEPQARVARGGARTRSFPPMSIATAGGRGASEDPGDLAPITPQARLQETSCAAKLGDVSSSSPDGKYASKLGFRPARFGDLRSVWGPWLTRLTPAIVFGGLMILTTAAPPRPKSARAVVDEDRSRLSGLGQRRGRAPTVPGDRERHRADGRAKIQAGKASALLSSRRVFRTGDQKQPPAHALPTGAALLPR